MTAGPRRLIPWLVALSVALAPVAARGEPSGDLAERKEAFELQKLALDVEKLKEQTHDWPPWLVGLLSALGGALLSLWGARLARHGALDQAVHEERLKRYPVLVASMSPLALYFPKQDTAGAAQLTKSQCAKIGRRLAKWYFGGGGLLLSTAARDSYFALARALTRASRSPAELMVPTFPNDAENVSLEVMNRFRVEIGGHLDLNDVEGWPFGASAVLKRAIEAKAHDYKDFVFLQTLSSALRTRLSQDLRSRRRTS